MLYAWNMLNMSVSYIHFQSWDWLASSVFNYKFLMKLKSKNYCGGADLYYAQCHFKLGDEMPHDLNPFYHLMAVVPPGSM